YAPAAVVKLYHDAYLLGAMGADLLAPMGRTAAELDVMDPYDLFEQTAAYAYESGSKCQLAYMLGMLTHYLLDSRINPYLYYFAENGVPHYFDEDKEIVTYEDIRASVDYYISQAHLDGKKEELRAFRARPDVVEDLGKLYERAVSRAVGHILPAKEVCACLANPKWSADRGVKMETLDYTNQEGRPWKTVRGGEWISTLPLEELLEKLEPIAVKMIGDYMARVRSGIELNKMAFRVNHLGVLLPKQQLRSAPKTNLLDQ
ncbi:MAG: zinc dependent phospholipase C family protein, partial [Clostridia bacterium]|nr:zinc dependent phospholipase C family protein [Clostridia bacterium]